MPARGVLATLRRARAALESGELGTASELFGKVLATPNTDPDSFAAAAYGMARCLHARGDLRRAERMYALAAGAGSDPTQQWNCCMALCHLAFSRQDLQEAIRYGSLALRCSPSTDRHQVLVTRQTLGSLYYDTGEYEHALEQLRAALDLNLQPEERGYLLYLIGRALIQQGARTEALRHLKEAVDLLGGDEQHEALALLQSL